MIAKTELSARKRRTRAEVQQLVAEFVSSGVRRSEFCQSRGLSFSTLDRHLKKRRWKRRRRRTSSAGRLVPVENPVATPIVAQVDELFAVDADARRKTLNTAARHIRRQETAGPLLDDIRRKIEAAQSAALPSSTLSKACQYALGLWKKLTRFLEYPELELSTNLAENSMRPVALGRKNWLHIGSPQAGPKVAAILSVVESCRRLPVRDYLFAILRLADLLIRCLPDLTPGVWVARKL